MFSECPRALYLYRRAHEEGADPDAPEVLRRQYFCSRMQYSYQYARSVVSTALREFFYFGSTENVTGWVLRRLARDRHAAGRGDNLGWNNLPVWMDPENVEPAVRDLLDQPFLPELLAVLGRVKPIDKLLIPVPLMTELADLTLAAAPVLLWRDGLKYTFLTFEAHESIDVILCRHALLRYRVPPDRVFFQRYDGRKEDAGGIAFSTELDHILFSARRMYAGEYPKTGDLSVCQRCRFRFCCDD